MLHISTFCDIIDVIFRRVINVEMDGVLVVDKPKGCTSHDIVYRVRKIVNKKVGHTGTLDPNATGVLPLLVGKGTLLSKYLINHDKKYEVVLKLGQKTSTADGEGNVIEACEVNREVLTEQHVSLVLDSFVGKQFQIPPMFSAIKVNGKKLYEYARRGEKVHLEPREIEIYGIYLMGIYDDEIAFGVSCSKGTYIRSLCENVAEKLGTVGFMKELKRTQVGRFGLDDAVNFEEILQVDMGLDEVRTNLTDTRLERLRERLEEKIVSVESVFVDRPRLVLKEDRLRLFFNGGKLNFGLENGVYKIYNSNNEFIGTGVIEDSVLKRDIIIDS